MISARLRKSFPEGPESRAFTLDVEIHGGPGVTVLFGPSGAGKTVALDCIAGFVRPDDGRILLDDVLLFDGGAKVCLPPRERRCGYVFQNYALFPHMTLRENLAFAARGAGARKRVGEMLERFRLHEMAGRFPRELSGGQKQRGSIARALLAEPKILLLDEPARGLDVLLREELYSVIRDVRREFSIPVVLVTHDLVEAMDLGDQMYVIQHGRVAQQGSPGFIVEQPASRDVARLLGADNILTAEILALDPGRNTSRLRIGDDEIAGTYYPGHLIGDTVTLLASPAVLEVQDAKTAPGGIRRALEHATIGPHRVHLQFDGGLRAEVDRGTWDSMREAGAFTVVFPPASLRLLRA